MPEGRRRFDADFRAGAVRIVKESGRPIAQLTRPRSERGHAGHLDRPGLGDHRRSAGAVSENDRVELARLRRENAELALERDVGERSVALWVTEAMGR